MGYNKMKNNRLHRFIILHNTALSFLFEGLLCSGGMLIAANVHDKLSLLDAPNSGLSSLLESSLSHGHCTGGAVKSVFSFFLVSVHAIDFDLSSVNGQVVPVCLLSASSRDANR